MYDEYRSKNGSATGVWIDGQYDATAAQWRCESFYYGMFGGCPATMQWASGEPNNVDTEHCVLVSGEQTGGVVSYACNETMPAICAANR